MLSEIGRWLVEPAGLTPHGFCLLWEPGLIWLHAGSDFVIGSSYLTIPFALMAIIRQRQDLLFRPVFILFAAFILFCGAGHWLDLLTLWIPAYGIEGVVKAMTAAISLLTAVATWKLIPAAVKLPSPSQLQAAHMALTEREEAARALQQDVEELASSTRHLAKARNAAEELARLRHYDPLTGLPNRSLLEEHLREIDEIGGTDYALLFLDLDRFKTINDTMGHSSGDMLLIEVAARLATAAKPNGLVARLGGDEFVVLCRSMDQDGAAAVAEQIRAAIQAPFDINGRTVHISASIGIAPGNRQDGLDLIRAADMAMYAAKQGGGNSGVAFEPAMFSHASQQFELEQEMREALAVNDQFVLLYQPLFHIASGDTRLVGFEALVRWRHPRHGWMSPGRFIPIAERSGLIVPLGNWVLATALRQGRMFRQANPAADLQMAVNVSALQLPQPGFCTNVADTLEAEGFPFAALCLEVTESVVTNVEASAALIEVRKLGVRVAIDDFGIGYSSLSYLRRLPTDVVKLDRSFLENLEAEGGGEGFVAAVIALVHATGKPVVFEGIETQAQLDIVSCAGADIVQGFFFAPPLSAHAAETLVQQSCQQEAKRLPGISLQE